MSSSVLITGAGGALGSAVGKAFHKAGWTPVLIEYSADKAEQLRSEYTDAVVIQADLTDAQAAEEAAEEALKCVGQIDAALAIAGGFSMQDAHKASTDDFERMFNLNVRTLFNTVQSVLPSMQEHGKGFILGVSAAAADQGGGGMALYAASKAAVAAYLRALRDELQGTGIGVATLYPMGALDTPANRESMPDADPDGWISLEELAQTILHLAERGSRGHVGEARVFAV